MCKLMVKVSLAFVSLMTLAVLCGCGEESDRPSNVHTLRVLAVRSETPFARPGTTVELSMLAFDGSPRARLASGPGRTTSTLWIGGCINPQGDYYGACVPHLHKVVEQLGAEHLAASTVPEATPAGVVGWGASFFAQIPDDIISSRRVAAGVAYPYGVEMVFFAHCGGVLRRVTENSADFPLGCFDRGSGEQLGRDDFEYGFYPLFVYQSQENRNPEILLVDLGGRKPGPPCSDSAPCADDYHCGTLQRCIPVISRCTAADKDDCAKHRLKVEVPESSVERAVVAHVSAADAPSETLWISYYANGGSFEQDATIVNEPNSGRSSGYDGAWRANVESNREVRLWAVVRDNRNGVNWVSEDVWVK